MKNELRRIKDVTVGLMEYRNTPITRLEFSPAQFMFNRRLKTKLPISNNLLKSEINNPINNPIILLYIRQFRPKFYYDTTEQSLKELKPDDNIVLFNFKTGKWDRGQNISKHKDPRSNVVKNANGEILRRNRKHLRGTKNSIGK